MKKAIVCGGGGFIGHHLSRRLREEGKYVISVDTKNPEFCSTDTFCDEFHLHDCSKGLSQFVADGVDEVYQLAADMGGAGYIFTGENDADVMSHSAMINIAVLNSCVGKIGKIFYSSSACIYPEFNQMDPDNPNCQEDSAYPAQPDSEYGWEKLFSERLFLAYNRNYKLPVAIGRFHNVYGTECTYNNGKEKVVLATCRKVLESSDKIKVWGSGNQTRSFLYIDDCLDGIAAVMKSNHVRPFNIGSEEKISINNLVNKVMSLVGKKLEIENIPGPLGVNGRNSDNTLITSLTGWQPKYDLDKGIFLTLEWLKKEMKIS